MKRGLWGLLILGMVWLAMPGRVYGKAGPGSPAAVATPVVQVHIPPFTAPATMPALGEELARGLYAALRDANIPVRLGKGDDGSAIVGRLEEISSALVRLQASYHGHSVQSVGDLEHLDDLVYAVFNQLRPRLQSAADSRSGALGPADAGSASPLTAVAGGSLPPPPVVTSSRTGVAAVSPAKVVATLPEPDRDSSSAAVRLASVRAVSSTHAVRPSTVSHRPAETPPTEPTAVAVSKEPLATSPPPSLPSPPTVNSEPVVETPPRPIVTPGPNKTLGTPRPPLTPFTFDPRRPRVAVHVVGDPVARIPAGYASLGAVGQRELISYLQQRLRIPAVASHLVGLTGGFIALDQSLRVGARHTLMARLDGLVLTPSPSSSPMGGGSYTGGTLSGRIHIVLLLDGKLLLDRSLMMPPTLVLPAESPAQAYARSVVAALDSVAGDLASRLAEPPPPSNPPSNPGNVPANLTNPSRSL